MAAAVDGRVVVIGLGVTGQAVVRHLGASRVVVVDDRPGEASRAQAADLGVDLVEAPDDATLDALVRAAPMVVPSPGVPASHPVYRLAREAGVELVGEVELAWRAAPMPMLAITGTNGKTTVTTLVAAMLVAGGRTAIAAGNIGLPLVDAVTQDVDFVVAEVSSFQLSLTSAFRPRVGAWLNIAEDHLDWHPTMEDYAAAKARIWANQGDGDVAVANAGDPVVMAATRGIGSRLVTFAEQRSDGDYTVRDGALVTPDGAVIAALSELPRHLPHDVANALAASAVAMSAGVDVAACRAVLTTFEGLPHRVTQIGDSGGVRFYDDSKATTPASVLAALQGFDSVVLIAGGRNKGLDLGVMAEAVDRVRAVVAIGEAAQEVAEAFDGLRPVTTASSMDAAVDAAVTAARPGDVVLLSPGCASYDWYSSYAERGDDFTRAVRERVMN